MLQKGGHVRVGKAVRRLSVDVVAKVVVGHGKQGDVGQGAQVTELLQLVLDEAGEDQVWSLSHGMI